MKFQKVFASRLLSLALAFSFLVVQVTAGMPQAASADTMEKIAASGQSLDNTDKTQDMGQQVAVSLEEAIKIARGAFQVPEDYDTFTPGFDQSNQGSFWNLHWNRSAESGGYIDIRVNAQTGEIWSMSQWNPPLDGSSYQGLPAYSRDEAEGIAAALAKELQPSRFKETRLQPGRDYFPPLLSQQRSQVEYNYNFARLVNGVPYLENSINITVNGDTGNVTGFSLNWDETAIFPNPSGSITKEQAEQVFRTDASPRLYYFRPRVSGGNEVPVKLVYGLPDLKTQVLIDALTGKILDNYGNYYGFYDMSGGEKKMANSRAQEYELNPVEVSAVEGAKNLLSQDAALLKARSAVSVPDEYILRSSRLEQDYLFTDKKNWHFSWESGDEPNRKWLDISVDAASGELVSFHLNRYRIMEDELNTEEPEISQADAQKIAESFIKKVQAEKWGQVAFKDAEPVMGPFISSEKPIPNSYTFIWSRVARAGIQFPDNGFTVEVDVSTGEIIGYQMNWYDVDFPDPQGVMEGEAAAGRFLQEAPLDEAYLKLWPAEVQWKGSSEDAKVYLTYRLTNQSFTMLDAFSGEPLNSDGKVVAASPEADGFVDLAGSPAREAVEMLADAGIIKAAGEFRPDDAVTQAELIAMLVRAGTYSEGGVKPLSTDSEEAWYQPYYEQAVQLGILQKGEQPDPDAPVTRIFMARLSIHAIGLYRVAKLSDIYVLNFQDAAEIPDYLKGHAAISVALGLIEPQEGNFRPQAFVSRGEAAITLVKLLNSWK